MINRVNTRANGDQLSDYLAALKDNERVNILEVDGRENADKEYLKQVILGMELNAALTKCKNPFLNAQINPAYGEDKAMSREDWYKAADILAEELGYQDQRRVIVLHTKKGRTHAHVVWERYDHATGKVVPTKNSKLKAQFARVRMEKEFGHKRTAWRNDKKHIKEAITEIWHATKTGAEFVKQARKAGYIISAGTGNRPFMIVDQNGVSCDLVRQIENVRTKEVRARLRHEPLMTDKEAIELIRNGQEAGSKRTGQQQSHTSKFEQAATGFKANKSDVLNDDTDKKKQAEKFAAFKADAEPIISGGKTGTKENNPKQAAASAFAENRSDSLNELTEQEQLRQKIAEQQQRIKARNKKRGPHH